MNAESFEKWWMDTAPALPPDDRKALAAAAWDAAVVAVARILDTEKNQLVSDKKYEQAATTRDARHLIHTLFVTPHTLCRFCGSDLTSRPERCPGCGKLFNTAI
jgi:hypothetical protein